MRDSLTYRRLIVAIITTLCASMFGLQRPAEPLLASAAAVDPVQQAINLGTDRTYWAVNAPSTAARLWTMRVGTDDFAEERSLSGASVTEMNSLAAPPAMAPAKGDSPQTSGTWQPPGAPGYSVSGAFTAQPPSAGNGNVGVNVTATGVNQRTGLQEDTAFGMKASSPCPDEEGNARGTSQWGFTKRYSVPGNGSFVSAGVQAQVSFVGHVDSSAQLIDYDATILVTETVESHLVDPKTGKVTNEATRGFTDTFQMLDLKPGKGVNTTDYDSASQRGTVTTTGGAKVDASAMTVGYIALSQVKDALESAQGNWDSNAGCMSVTFSPSPLSIPAGGTAQVTAQVTSKSDGSPVDIVLAGTTDEDLTVTPTHQETDASGRITYTLKAASNPANAYGNSHYLHVEGTSPQGRARGYVDVTITKATPHVFQVTFAGSATYDRTQTYDDSPSNDVLTHHATFSWSVEQDNVTLSGQKLLFTPGPGVRSLSGQDTSTYTSPWSNTTCQTPVMDGSPATASALQQDPDGSVWMIAGDEVADYLIGTGSQSPCGFDLGALNPGYTTTLPSWGYFNGTEALQAHFTPAWDELQSVPVGGTYTVGLDGPIAPVVIPSDCNVSNTSGYSCQQSETWNGQVTFTRIQ
jgi:hypothetical protein